MKKEPVVFFTSCDENYIKHIPTLLMSIHEYMSAYPIEFYLLHVSIGPEQIGKLQKLCRKLNITFQAVQITGEDLAQYQTIKQLVASESPYPIEGYFDMLPNLHLPPHVERALYLDTGDIILAGDISQFYFSDFKGNLLTVSKGFSENWDYVSEDLYDPIKYLQLVQEYFNAGSILFDVMRMRQSNIHFDYYISIMKLMRKVQQTFKNYYLRGKDHFFFDDQGVLGAAFVGAVNFFDPDNAGNTNTSYNFRPYVLECNKQNIPNAAQLTLENVQPKIIHLLGNKPGTPHQKRKTLLKISQQCLQLWDKFEEKASKAMEGLE